MSRPNPPPLVELRAVRLTLGGRLVLRDVTWTVRRGEGWIVTGPNGAGKTSLLRILAGNIWPDPGKKGGERIYHFGRRASASPIGLERRLAWLSPETHQSFARLDTPILAGEAILTGFANTLLLTHRPTTRQRASARRFAQKLGVSHFWRRPFAELSQGQQRLILVARALVSKPALLVLDEFSDGLDHTSRAKIGAMIVQRLRAGATVIVATHRTGDVLPGLSRHLALQNGRAVETLMPKGGVGAPLRVVRATKTSARPSPPILKFEHASVFIGDHTRTKRILRDLTWTVHPSERWAILGANGSGKTTLLRAIYGELSVARGGILERFGRNEIALPLPDARRLMGWISPALHHHYHAAASVLEVAASGFQSTIGLLRPPTPTERARALASLRKLGAARLARRRWGELSFGEARLALLARALAPQPRLLLLDEPGDGLAPPARARFMRAVERAARAGTQIIIAAHRAEDLPDCVNRLLRLAAGRIV